MLRIVYAWTHASLIRRIAIGVVIGTLLGILVPSWGWIALIGDLFVGALKAIAPILVFTLVSSALSKHQEGKKTNVSLILGLYLTGTFLAAVTAVIVNLVFPISIKLGSAQSGVSAPQGIWAVFRDLLLKLVDNPVTALANANYIGILAWAVIFGLAFRSTSSQTKQLLEQFADVTSQIIRWIINLAPFGILGLIFNAISESGIGIFANYALLILVLIATMAFVALVINPLIGWIIMRRNPYPLVFRVLKDSGITAFFTRSSAANIPVNLRLCEELGLNKDTYAVSIPLGSTINMAGAAITINTLTLAATNTLGIQVDLATAIVLSFVAAISACGASGVAGGSLLLIPVACSLFGISNDQAMQVVAVGFIISVIQDSMETALNSSTDVYFTAVAEWAFWKQKRNNTKV